MSVKNVSDNSIVSTPVRVVIESISANDVAVENADGTINRKLYFEYAVSEGLLPGDITGIRKWRFSNRKEKRMNVRAIRTRQNRGDCGCGTADTDSDNEGTSDCNFFVP